MSGGVRPAELARAGWGTMLLLAPRRVLGVLDGSAPDERAVLVARVLGGRHLLQAVVTLAVPSPATSRAGAAVDLLHAASSGVLVRLDPSRVRSIVVDAALATGWAVLSLRDADASR